MRVLLVEDDRRIMSFLRKGFQEAAFNVDAVDNGEDGLRCACTDSYDVIILDLMLPRRDGFEVVSELRARRISTPVVCLTARDAVDDRVRGLDLGADDYLTKPFSFAELLARVRAVLRRGQDLNNNTLVVADLRIDRATRAVCRGERRIDLSPTEYALLECLARNRGQVLPRSMLLAHVWGIRHDPLTNVVEVHINRLRKKVDYQFNQQLIHTVRGVGYVLQSEPA